MTDDFDPDGLKLPIKLDSCSNGEFEPIALTKREKLANQHALEQADKNRRRLAVARRSFLKAAVGTASTLLAFNAANAAAGKVGGSFDVPKDAALDSELADSQFDKQEFIFDVQGHYVDPNGDWLKKMPASARPFSGMSDNACVQGKAKEGGREYMQCLNADSFIKDVFLDSDTDMMVLSFVPSRRESEPLTIEEADATRRIVDAMEGNHRLMLHGRVNPNQDGDMEGMDELAEKYNVAAFKTYTQWGPDGTGFFLSDEDTGIPFIEKARSLGVKNIAVHKGLAFGPKSYEHSKCTDIGVVAKRFPDMNFLIYHSGFDMAVTETAFEEGSGKAGIDGLIQSMMDNGIGKQSNVYAELGSTWRFLMRDPDQAGHVMGKLLKHIGEDNILYGSDSVWYGSPQDQIDAFRTFQISKEYREKYGYPEITKEARAKIFGLNGAKVYGLSVDDVKKHTSNDSITRKRLNYAENKNPHYRTFGPKNRREFLALNANSGGKI